MYMKQVNTLIDNECNQLERYYPNIIHPSWSASIPISQTGIEVASPSVVTTTLKTFNRFIRF